METCEIDRRCRSHDSAMEIIESIVKRLELDPNHDRVKSLTESIRTIVNDNIDLRNSSKVNSYMSHVEFPTEEIRKELPSDSEDGCNHSGPTRVRVDPYSLMCRFCDTVFTKRQYLLLKLIHTRDRRDTLNESVERISKEIHELELNN